MIFIAAGAQVKAEVDAFYSSQSRDSRIDPSDVVVGQRDGKGLAGVVRLCFEQGFVSLRSMQVRQDLQRQGVGSQLLRRFVQLLDEQKINYVYCMPYAHLESFYAQIGFVRLMQSEEALVPPQLWKRLDKHRNRKPSLPVILMRRPST